MLRIVVQILYRNRFFTRKIGGRKMGRLEKDFYPPIPPICLIMLGLLARYAGRDLILALRYLIDPAEEQVAISFAGEQRAKAGGSRNSISGLSRIVQTSR